jgi:hypothetical protein
VGAGSISAKGAVVGVEDAPLSGRLQAERMREKAKIQKKDFLIIRDISTPNKKNTCNNAEHCCQKLSPPMSMISLIVSDFSANFVLKTFLAFGW